MKIKLTLLTVLLAIGLGGCASMNDSLTANPTVGKSDWDNSPYVVQSPLSASSSMLEGWHALGLFWTAEVKNIVSLNVGVYGIKAVQSVSLNIDGHVINLKPLDSATDIKINNSGVMTGELNWSYKNFAISMKDFKKLVHAKNVKMRVRANSQYTVSTLGTNNPDAVINSKLPKFLKLVEKNMPKSKKTTNKLSHKSKSKSSVQKEHTNQTKTKDLDTQMKELREAFRNKEITPKEYKQRKKEILGEM